MKTLALIAAVLLSGCDADILSDASAGVPVAAPRAAAPFDPAVLTGHSLGGSTIAQMQLLATPRGREVLAQVVSCALPLGASLTAINGDGTPYSFAGGIGLAPAWAERAPTAHERQRIAACLHAGAIRA
jgi:hypothetical protein